MTFSTAKIVATLLLSGQTLPLGLPLLCDQAQRGTPANCEQQMASQPSGPVIDVTRHVAPCANPAFCAVTASAVLSLHAAMSISASESPLLSFDLPTFVPVDPQPPLPPPPQA